MVHRTDWVDGGVNSATNPWRLDDGVPEHKAAPVEAAPSKDAKKSSGYDIVFGIFCCGLLGLAAGLFIAGVMVPIKVLGKLFEYYF